MNRRGFLASLVALPAAIKAIALGITAPKTIFRAIVPRYDFKPGGVVLNERTLEVAWIGGRGEMIRGRGPLCEIRPDDRWLVIGSHYADP